VPCSATRFELNFRPHPKIVLGCYVMKVLQMPVDILLRLPFSLPNRILYCMRQVVGVADGVMGKCVDPEGNGVSLGKKGREGAQPT
jgi:hypothetical protein